MRLSIWNDEDKIKTIAVYKANKIDTDYLKRRAVGEKVIKRLDWLLNKIHR